MLGPATLVNAVDRGDYTRPGVRSEDTPVWTMMYHVEDGLDEGDAILCARLHARDVGALEALYDRHARALFSLALRMLADYEAAEEVVQETFLKLWQRPDRYEPERGRLLTWLLGVAHHRAVDRLRRRRLE